ncbi:MAG: hypothetical protein JO363_12235 [Solirubrobacterales bacterium]|nr:hypothetical protein [Solirubrobacterales bacterium]
MLAFVLVMGIALSAFAKAPRRPLPPGELRRLVLAALSLYAVGVCASLTHHAVLAGVVYVAGISACALAAWLSRGSDSDGPPGGDEPIDEEPPPDPDGIPAFDWRAFEEQFRSYAERRREPAGAGR